MEFWIFDFTFSTRTVNNLYSSNMNMLSYFSWVATFRELWPTEYKMWLILNIYACKLGICCRIVLIFSLICHIKLIWISRHHINTIQTPEYHSFSITCLFLQKIQKYGHLAPKCGHQNLQDNMSILLEYNLLTNLILNEESEIQNSIQKSLKKGWPHLGTWSLNVATPFWGTSEWNFEFLIPHLVSG